MSFDSDALIDRRRLKRRLALWRVLAVLAAAGIALAYFARGDVLIGRDHVARLEVTGVIVEDRARARALERVARDDDAKALIVYLDSPGGTVVGGETLYRGLREVAARKPVVAVMGSLATSGGYMAAIGADHILARAGTVTGSIGVIMQTADVTGLLEKLGIEAEAIKSAPLKGTPSPLEELTDKAREATRAVVMDMYEMFVDMVAERRGLPREKALDLSDGRVYTGRQAAANGLIDGLGGEEQARAWLAESHGVARDLPVIEVRIPREREGLLDYVDGLMGKTLFSERLRLDGLVSVWQPERS